MARTRAEVLATSGSRYTYSANLLAYADADRGGRRADLPRRHGVHDVGPGAMQARKAGKVARRLSLTIGLMCSKTFDDAIFEELF